MRYMNEVDLIAVIPGEWGIRKLEDLHVINMAVEKEPERMRRIYDLTRLLFEKQDLRQWAFQPLEKDANAIDLIALGGQFFEGLENLLLDRFSAVCPRFVFPMSGQVTDFEGSARVLKKLIWDRITSEGGDLTPLHDVTLAGHVAIQDPGERIALAVSDLLSEYDGIGARLLIVNAIMDPDKDVRIIAVRGAHGFLGYGDVASAVASLRSDPDPDVALEAVTALAKFANVKDIAELIVDFLTCLDARVRRRAVQALAKSRLDNDVRISIIGIAFDPVAEVRAEARRLFSQVELENYVNELRRNARDGDSLRPFDLGAIMRSEAENNGEESVWPDIIAGRLRRLVALNGDFRDIETTIKSLRNQPENITHDVWVAIEEALESRPGEVFEPALMPFIAKCSDADAMRVAEKILRSPARNDHASVRVGFAEAVVAAAEGSPASIRRISAICLDDKVDNFARTTVMWAVSRAESCEKEIGEIMEAVLERKTSPESMAMIAMDWCAGRFNPDRLRKVAAKVFNERPNDAVKIKAGEIMAKAGDPEKAKRSQKKTQKKGKGSAVASPGDKRRS